jgi:hypothetical protein
MSQRSRKQEPEGLDQITQRMTQYIIDAGSEPDLSDDDIGRRIARALGSPGGKKGGSAKSSENKQGRTQRKH